MSKNGHVGWKNSLSEHWRERKKQDMSVWRCWAWPQNETVELLPLHGSHCLPHVAVGARLQWHAGVINTCLILFLRFALFLWHNQILFEGWQKHIQPSWFVAVGKNVPAVNWALVNLHSSVNRIHAVLLYVAAAVLIDQRNNILNWINRRPDTICSSGAAHLILGWEGGAAIHLWENSKSNNMARWLLNNNCGLF